MSLLRTVSLFGLVLLLLGGGGVALGSVVSATDTCTSGYGITLYPLDGNESVDSEAGVVAFEELPPVEQRVFLEAYTDPDRQDGGYGSSPAYEDGVPWNNDVQFVEYRGERFEVSGWVGDCGPGYGPVLRVFSTPVALLGALVFSVARAVEVSRRDDE